MPTTKVINGTGKPLTLKEGTAGIFTTLKKLKPDDFYLIVVDTNATYREYWCAVKADDPDGGVVLSSDDCEDLKEVTIIATGDKANPSYSYKGVTRGSGKATTEGARSLDEASNSEPPITTGEPQTTKHGGLFTWLRGIFKKPDRGSSSSSQTRNSGDSSVV